ncbi:hypothetical protein [Natrinema versiforme]|uniref:PRC-barrel domain containing protein n=1 Tax=Natrinema versiforme TaxID=88724 RepID=A0A4P8WEP7_9EURY|nr:hypothetical protein [Natrinema versiforme]QCS41670.1 hypothetical protein FEJ81_04610 [Natrinema versiforme]
MSPTFTDDDIDKPVESADGETLGTVATIDGETAHIDPEPDMTDSIKAVLDWEPASGDIVPLESDAVDEITDDAVRIGAAFSAESVEPDDESAAEAGNGRSDERDGGSEPRVGGDSAAGPESAPDTGAATDVPGADRDPDSGRPEESESIADDEYYDTVEGGARVDPDREMDETEEPATKGTESSERAVRSEETEPGEERTARDVDVDPDDVTDGDPDAEIRSGEDVGDRTDS